MELSPMYVSLVDLEIVAILEEVEGLDRFVMVERPEEMVILVKTLFLSLFELDPVNDRR